MKTRKTDAGDYATFDQLLAAVRACRVCEAHLPLGPRPVIQARETARVLIVGQAPGARVHETGIPWDDPSGERLRRWMGIDSSVFYDASRVAIIPMGYCYPGRAKGGDAPPRPECARLWHSQLLSWLPSVELTLLVGLHAQRHYLRKRAKPTLSQTVKSWREYAPEFIPLPHPSPRNQPWFARHPWFEAELAPALQRRARSVLDL
ncbi:MAG TPA: uracil-DNA glycosylase family protein [Gemmatimonadaceae bacterium]